MWVMVSIVVGVVVIFLIYDCGKCRVWLRIGLLEYVLFKLYVRLILLIFIRLRVFVVCLIIVLFCGKLGLLFCVRCMMVGVRVVLIEWIFYFGCVWRIVVIDFIVGLFVSD